MRLNVIATFNKLKINKKSKNYTTFVILLGVYKY